MRAIHEKEMADIACQTTTKKDTKNGRSERLYALIALAWCVYKTSQSSVWFLGAEIRI